MKKNVPLQKYSVWIYRSYGVHIDIELPADVDPDQGISDYIADHLFELDQRMDNEDSPFYEHTYEKVNS